MQITFNDLEEQRAVIIAERDRALNIIRQTEGALAMLEVMLSILNKPEAKEKINSK